MAATRRLHFLGLSTDPNNKGWANDKSGFGFKMLEKMGWSKGKGLGVNEDGITEHVKAKKNIENRGIGAGSGGVDWRESSHEFGSILANLKATRAESESESEEEEKEKKRKKRKSTEKEKKSKKSRKDESSDEESSEDERKSKKSKKNKKVKKSKKEESSEEESESSEDEKPKKKSKKSKKDSSSEDEKDSGNSSSEERTIPKHLIARKKQRFANKNIRNYSKEDMAAILGR